MQFFRLLLTAAMTLTIFAASAAAQCPPVSGTGCDNVAWQTNAAWYQIEFGTNICDVLVRYCYRTNGCGKHEIFMHEIEFQDPTCVAGQDLHSADIFDQIMEELTKSNPWPVNASGIPDCPDQSPPYIQLVLATCFQAYYTPSNTILMTVCETAFGCIRTYTVCYVIDSEGQNPPKLVTTAHGSTPTLILCQEPQEPNDVISWEPSFGTGWFSNCVGGCE